MSSDYEILKQKFTNFKVFIKEISRKDTQINKFEMLSDDQWLVLVNKNIVPHFNSNSLDTVMNEMIEYLDIDQTNEENINKLKRYLECFSEYLMGEQKKELQQHIAQASSEMEESDDPYLKELANLKL